MRALCQRTIVTVGVLLAAVASAASPAGERYIDLMVNGGPPSIRDAARSIVSTGERDPEVLDVAAEVLLQGYAQPGNTQIDAMAWLCKALGQSGNARYRAALEEVAGTAPSSKLKKYASQALGSLPDGGGEAYVKGTVDLQARRERSAQAPAAPPAGAAQAPASGQAAAGRQPLSVVTVGMSMDEVYDLIGHPTSTTGHITGKAFVPYYYGGDTSRTIALYKGQGRVVFSRKGRYSSTFRVVEVLPDPKESGYP